MSAKTAVLAASAMLAACVPVPLAPHAPLGASASDYLARCQGKDGWDDPAPPLKLYGNTYAVGTCGIVALLIVSNAGHVLIDGGTGKGAALIAANIRALGIELGDVRWIVTSHEHFDHVGGVAELQRLTGAKLAAMPAAAAVLAAGKAAAEDPQFGVLPAFDPARVDRILRDGDVVELGGLRLTAHATPGHAPGSTSWTWQSCDGSECLTIAYADSTSAISDKQYRYSAHPAYVATFNHSLDKIGALPCDILLTPHPAASDLFARLAGTRPLVDPTACARYAERGRQGLAARVARDATGPVG